MAARCGAQRQRPSRHPARLGLVPIGTAVLLGVLVLASLAVLPLLVLLVPVLAVLAVIALVCAGLGVLSMVLWGVLPLFIVWLIWRLATGGAKDGEAL